MSTPAGTWDSQIWGRKAPAKFQAWGDVEVGTDGVRLCSLLRKPRVERASLKAQLLAGRCFFAGVPLCSFISTQGEHGQQHWSLVTLTWHTDIEHYDEWLSKFAAEDVYAFRVGESCLPKSLDNKLAKLGKVLNVLPGKPTYCQGPDGGYVLAPREQLHEEQLIVERTITTMPDWAKAEGSWVSIAIQEYSKERAKFAKNGLYGIRMMGMFATGNGKQGPCAGFSVGDVHRSSPKLGFKADNFGFITYDHEMSKQMYVSEFFTKWFAWKQLGECECLFTIILDAECSQWQENDL